MSTSKASARTPKQKQARRAMTSSLVGTSIEWFEFFIYGTAAAIYFGPLFFPSDDPIVGRLIAFASFGVAFLARPLGAVIFGHLGDRIGRRATLITTLSLMGAATGAIGLLPTFDQIGLAAPVILVTLRLLQGLAVGGEWGGAVLVAVENAPRNKVRLYGSAPQMGSPIGLILATGIMSLVALIPEEARFDWGWRIPFLTGFVLVAIGLIIRLGVEESEDFTKVKSENKRSRVPIGDLFRFTKVPLLVGIGLQSSVNVVFYIVATYFLSYAVNYLEIPQGTALLLVMLAAVVDVIALPLIASLADKIGPTRIFLGGAIFAIVMGFPFFLAINTAQPIVIFIALTLAMVGAHATTYSVLSSMIAELYPTRYRYSGAAATYAIAALIWSAPTPFLAEYLMKETGAWQSLVAMTTVAGVIASISTWGYFRISHRMNVLGVDLSEASPSPDRADSALAGHE
jgi:MHS family shikimate/dehydroshikimate transporter-like MFS transporter